MYMSQEMPNLQRFLARFMFKQSGSSIGNFVPIQQEEREEVSTAIL